MVAKNLPSYKKPPVIEVVAGVQFSSLADLKIPFLGDVWNCIGREDYPDFQEVEPLPKMGVVSDEKFALMTPEDFFPRSWFISKDKTNLIQFQRDRFLLNWRKIGEQDEYPRYDNVIDEFFKNYKAIMDLFERIEVKPPELEMLELTYVNEIPFEVALDRLDTIFEDLEWKKSSRFLEPPKKFNFSWQFEIPETSALADVRVGTAQRFDDGKKVLKMELSTRGQFGGCNISEMKDWYDVSREWIVRAFTDMTTDEMHKTWERET